MFKIFSLGGRVHIKIATVDANDMLYWSMICKEYVGANIFMAVFWRVYIDISLLFHSMSCSNVLTSTRNFVVTVRRFNTDEEILFFTLSN